MPISVTCPECSSTYRVADEAAGKAIKCKKCGARVAVPAAADDDLSALKPGAPSNGDEAGAEGGAPKAKKKSNMTLIIVLAGVLVAFCCICLPGGGFATWWFGFRTTENRVEIKAAKDVVIKDNPFKDNPFKDIEKAFKDNPFKDATKKKS